jgi:glyoxylase-like metal-dependent hydrolase (beta-lactamase superfamily II)
MTIDVLSELLRLAPDVYGLRWDNHVAMFTVTPDGVLVVDPCGEGNANTPSLLKAAIRSVTDLPVRYVVYSHSAWDHSMGGVVFADTAQFVSQTRARDRMAEVGEPSSPVADITFEDTLTLELGGRHWDLYASKLTPVDDYIVLHDPAARLLMYVDCFQPSSIPLPLHGLPADLQKRIEWLRSFDFDLLITGHATPRVFLTKEELQPQSDYLTDLAAAIAAAEKAGHAPKSPEMTAFVLAALEARWTGWRRYPDRVGPHIANCFDYAAGIYPEPRLPRQ